MNFFEVRTEFFRPAWRRVLAVVLVVGWALIELGLGNPTWAAVFGAAGLYLSWAFFLAFEKGPAGKDDE
jgi:hypothetical protein